MGIFLQVGLITVVEILNTVSSSPLLAIVGLVAILAIVLAPIALRVAGLTGSQIIELLRSTMSFIVQVIHEFRASNKEPQ